MEPRTMTDVKGIITVIVARMRLLPFLYVALYIPFLICSFIGGDWWYAANEVCYISPAICLLTLWAGWRMQFCIFWKMQCLLPILPAALGMVQHYCTIRTADPYIATVLIVVVGSIINGILVVENRNHENKH